MKNFWLGHKEEVNHIKALNIARRFHSDIMAGVRMIVWGEKNLDKHNINFYKDENINKYTEL